MIIHLCVLYESISLSYYPHSIPQYISATATFDILRNYARLSEEVISNLKEMIDDPSNAFLVAPHLHRGWEKFRWCLKATEVQRMKLSLSGAEAFMADPRQICYQVSR
jgi:hypothetical protein